MLLDPIVTVFTRGFTGLRRSPPAPPETSASCSYERELEGSAARIRYPLHGLR